jgi:enoyl-CoA hydratase/carnithine racemase
MMSIEYKKEGKIAIFTINSPETLNAFSPEAARELSKALMDFRDDEGLWVGIITGAGEKAFCAGADIKTMLPFYKENMYTGWKKPASIYKGLELWKPIIAAVNGLCLGGGMEIALACDFRIAAEKAIFGFPEAKLGVVPGMGGTQRLPRLVPFGKAAEMMFTGDSIDAQEAYRIGMVNKVVPLAELMPTTMKIAEKICQAGPIAVRAIKQAMYQGVDVSMEQGLQIEAFLLGYAFNSEDFDEGIKAFIEKRKPDFKAK